ncbi:unnamed protein product [Protopolystoma xenopodis]|uniref:Uncharacterized protein n=1 Tax=Protopolystoma xenopodis TaxID=117903 RepID=A0A448XNS4_9PLAT|nr:unnamed protein product [Protopolystoma xenopodis]
MLHRSTLDLSTQDSTWRRGNLANGCTNSGSRLGRSSSPLSSSVHVAIATNAHLYGAEWPRPTDRQVHAHTWAHAHNVEWQGGECLIIAEAPEKRRPSSVNLASVASGPSILEAVPTGDSPGH